MGHLSTWYFVNWVRVDMKVVTIIFFVIAIFIFIKPMCHIKLGKFLCEMRLMEQNLYQFYKLKICLRVDFSKLDKTFYYFFSIFRYYENGPPSQEIRYHKRIYASTLTTLWLFNRNFNKSHLNKEKLYPIFRMIEPVRFLQDLNFSSCNITQHSCLSIFLNPHTHILR